MACKQLLEKNQILDVHCELELSEAYRVTNPALVKPSASWTPTVDVEVDLTPTIGTCIAQADLLSEGTFGFYVKFPEHGNNVFAVTCRHVLFPVSANKLYHHKIPSQPRRLVLLPGTRYLGMMRERAVNGAQGQQIIIDTYKRDLSALAGQEGRDAKKAQKRAQHTIDEAMETMKDFQQLVKDLDTKWKTPESRTVGHVVYSPPISTGEKPNNYTMDWALYQVDPSKIKNFSGNVIDLGHDVSVEKVNQALNPNVQNPYKFAYPAGIANEVESYVRTYSSEIGFFESKEWAILGYDKSFSPFSDKGDSGALVVDAEGRMGGMLTGGSGFSAKIDVTYATPIVALLQDMHNHGWKRPKPIMAP